MSILDRTPQDAKDEADAQQKSRAPEETEEVKPMHDEPMTLERLRERLDQVEGRSWEAKVEARSWILRGCAALMNQLRRLEEESDQWEKASLVEIMDERDQLRRDLLELHIFIAGLERDRVIGADVTDWKAAIMRVVNERNEQRAFVRWYESLMARADVGSPETPTLRAYIERLEARDEAKALATDYGKEQAQERENLREELAQAQARIERWTDGHSGTLEVRRYDERTDAGVKS